MYHSVAPYIFEFVLAWFNQHSLLLLWVCSYDVTDARKWQCFRNNREGVGELLPRIGKFPGHEQIDD